MKDHTDTTVLKATGLKKKYTVGRHTLTAVDGVDLDLAAGETLGIVGESGCGKSTLARLLVGLELPDAGEVSLAGNSGVGKHRSRKHVSREIQMVFQDPYTALNPRMTVGDIVREPFEIHRNLIPKHKRDERVAELFEMVGLAPEHRNRFPSEFSGGQRQRIGIARPLALEPKVIVCDEPVAALDVSVQAQVINLLQDLQKALGISYIFIAHDLSIMRQISDRIAVMYLGRLVETGPVSEVFERPRHPYTRALIEAVPLPDPFAETSNEFALQGDVPSPLKMPTGCAFRTRCPLAQEVCSTVQPKLEETASGGRSVACHFPLA